MVLHESTESIREAPSREDYTGPDTPGRESRRKRRKESDMANEKRACINWAEKERRWVLRLWIDEEWVFSKSWSVKSDGVDQLTGAPLDWVHDSILCEIAHLQELGYKVSVYC